MQSQSKPKNPGIYAPPIERLLSKFEVDPETGCWIWTASVNNRGYGVFWDGQKTQLAHRASYEWFIGPIPDGFTVDHLCRVRLCICPDDFEAVPNKENILRGEGLTARYARATHCKNGHPLSGDNLFNHPRGARECRTCGQGPGK